MSNPTYANQGAVSTIADDALVMAVGSDGRDKPVSFANLMSAVKRGIQIGGGNLVKGTEEPATLNGSGTIIKTYTLAETLKWSELVGKSFTVAFDYEYSNVTTGSAFNQCRFVISIGLETAEKTVYKEAQLILKTSASGLSGKGRKWYSFEVPAGVTNTTSKINASIQVLSGNVTMSNIKIEEGNIATAWSPAYEDLRGG